jgi:hypothetical protein
MVPLDPGGVIFSLEDGFTQHDEWLGESDAIGCSSFLLDVIEGLPSPFGEGTFEKIVLRGFRGLFCANPKSRDEVSYHSSDLVTHPLIGVPIGCQVPH